VQIMKTFCLTRAVPRNVKAVTSLCSLDQQLFIESLTSHNRRAATALKFGKQITLLGFPKVQRLSRSHFVALHSVSATVKSIVVSYYDRAVIDNELVHSRNYSKNKKRNSSTVRLANGDYYQVVTFIVADLGSGDSCYAIGRYIHAAPFQLCRSKVVNLKLNHIVPVLKIPSALVAVAASDIVGKCVFIASEHFDVNFICEQLHLFDCCL
jgi:hypothetical protein